ncbi:solute carrier family 35 member F2-like isoform X5 [Phyllopteryx taeniolatus]|uniref:solute carrier family 35 member F2-like isoform X5 n=1 Tax=Phyllopteryx taeniolatus TaxID=161469 RepID=UPI002AD3B0AD|nr:solute carrier family 35 member F2-like isoform X5 [Phyllopteryx taeniolatus]
MRSYLLDCFVIPVVMFLSWWLLKTRYRPVHYAAVCVCLLGVGAMVGADLLAGRDQGSASNVLLGDGLVLLSGVLYGLSNVWQEYAVKNRSRLEFLGMLGLFGTIISTAQMSVLELRQISAIRWSWQVGECHTTARFVGFGLETLPRLLRSALLFGAFACCMLALYSLMPVVVKESSAAAVNLSMLTADVFAIFCGIFIFRYSVSPGEEEHRSGPSRPRSAVTSQVCTWCRWWPSSSVSSPSTPYPRPRAPSAPHPCQRKVATTTHPNRKWRRDRRKWSRGTALMLLSALDCETSKMFWDFILFFPQFWKA